MPHAGRLTCFVRLSEPFIRSSVAPIAFCASSRSGREVPAIHGLVFVDLNQDGAQDADEPARPASS